MPGGGGSRGGAAGPGQPGSVAGPDSRAWERARVPGLERPSAAAAAAGCRRRGSSAGAAGPAQVCRAWLGGKLLSAKRPTPPVADSNCRGAGRRGAGGQIGPRGCGPAKPGSGRGVDCAAGWVAPPIRAPPAKRANERRGPATGRRSESPGALTTRPGGCSSWPLPGRAYRLMKSRA